MTPLLPKALLLAKAALSPALKLIIDAVSKFAVKRRFVKAAIKLATAVSMPVMNPNALSKGGRVAKNPALLLLPPAQRSTILNLVRRSNAHILASDCCIYNISYQTYNSFKDLTDELAGLKLTSSVYPSIYSVDLMYYPPTPKNKPVLTDFANLTFDHGGDGQFNILIPYYSSPNPMQGYQFRINNYAPSICDGNCFSEVFTLNN